MKKVLLIALALLIAFPVLASNNKEKKQKDKDKYVKLTTQYGSCVIKLYTETPLHSENFVKLAKEKFFDSTLFHRVIKDFMIQGGDPDSKRAVAGQMLGEGGPTYTIPAEFNKLYIHRIKQTFWGFTDESCFIVICSHSIVCSSSSKFKFE